MIASLALLPLVSCEDRVSSDLGDELDEQLLRKTESTDLAKALIPFVLDPPDGSTAEPLPIRWTEDGYPHLSESDKWNQTRVEADGFNINFEIECRLESDEEWTFRSPRLGWVLGGHHFHKSGSDYWRGVRCYPGKGETNFEERRVFAIDFATSQVRWFAVSIVVSDNPRDKKTVGDLLGLLRRHYPTYARLCRDIELHIRR